MTTILKHLAGIDKPSVVVFGITGKQGRSRTKLMKEFGTSIPAGVTPGKKGETVCNIPVYNNCAEAVSAHPEINCAVYFIPPGAIREAFTDAVDCGIKFSLIVADGICTHDAIVMKEYAKEKYSTFTGPNTVGILDTEGLLMGMIGGRASWASENYKPGSVGIISRSGGLSQLFGSFMCRKNLIYRTDNRERYIWQNDFPGISAIICTGGDPVPGTSLAEAALAFEKDERTKIIAGYGETGTMQENDLAALVKNRTIRKPVVIFLGGRYTAEGIAQSHAGAMIRNESETWEYKKQIMQDAGIHVVYRPADLFFKVKKLIPSCTS